MDIFLFFKKMGRGTLCVIFLWDLPAVGTGQDRNPNKQALMLHCTFSFSSFRGLSPLMYLKLICVQGERQGSSSICFHVDIHNLLKKLSFFSPMSIFSIFVKRLVAIALCIYIRIFYSVPLI